MTEGYVYVIESSTGLYKIGHTTNPKKRLTMLRTSTADNLKMLGVVPATRQQEGILHHLLRDHRVEREWFRPCRAMQPLLEALRPVPGRPARVRRETAANEPWRARVRQAIEADSRSYAEISVAAGLGVNFVSQMLTTGKAPTTRSLIKLAAALGMSPALIFARAA